jgi:hypothetical protein
MSGQQQSLESLRALVREALGDLLPEIAKALPDGPPSTPRSAPAKGEATDEVETVALGSDADLAAFVRRLIQLSESSARREDLRSGRLRFRLAANVATQPPQSVHRIDKGVVTEATIREVARSGAKLVLGPNAVLTPLGRDRARADGVQVEKEH